MAARYEVRLLDQTGAQVSVIVEWVSLRYTARVNGVGEYELRIDQSSPAMDQVFNLPTALDTQVEVRRQDLAASPVIEPYTDFGGFHRTPSYETDAQDDDTFRSVGVSWDHLLARRVIAYPTGGLGAAKSGVGETVMRDYVNENGGPLSTVLNGRQVAGVFPGLAIPTTGGAGSAWEGDRAGRNLLDVLREISDATDVDFRVVDTGPITWEFQASATPIGADRSVVGLDPATGLNGAGNVPVIFSLERANMGAPAFSTNRVGERTVAIVQGQGIEAARVVRVRSTAASADSPWNAIEASFNASQESATAALDVVGDAKLQELQARETFAFDVLQQPGTLYGREYFLGDRITARYLTFERNIQIAAVSVDVQGGVENIAVELSDVTP